MLRKLCSLRHSWFLFAFLLIAFVSLYDTYLIIQFRGVINQTEENPVGRFLLKMGNGHVGIFVRMKLAGTVCVLSTLLAMWVYRSRLVIPVTSSIASYQTGLFLYLTVS